MSRLIHQQKITNQHSPCHWGYHDLLQIRHLEPPQYGPSRVARTEYQGNVYLKITAQRRRHSCPLSSGKAAQPCTPTWTCTTALYEVIRKTTDIEALRRCFHMSSGFRHVKGNTIIVPIVNSEHWSLAILSGEHFLKFDSNSGETLHGSTKLHQSLGKLWCMAVGHEEGSATWVNATDLNSWIRVKCPQQGDDWSCGYYVMCYIIMYVTYWSNKQFVDWRQEMSHIFGEKEVLEIKAELKIAILRAIVTGLVDDSECKVSVGFHDVITSKVQDRTKVKTGDASPPRRSGRIKEKTGATWG
ncbi:hypothetical protein KC19_1G277000 [Ceratodon purpureus]|uniref:Ubiquitin-like protease family profile domain-containing protein n=1 Tax=Ceratodon purpureus TaxID=3225 RepID=A0A8T0JCW4_CERPU|nr:hypothetical protein KC19_1G277000 [Ceratodon purpureus]